MRSLKPSLMAKNDQTCNDLNLKFREKCERDQGIVKPRRAKLTTAALRSPWKNNGGGAGGGPGAILDYPYPGDCALVVFSSSVRGRGDGSPHPRVNSAQPAGS